MTVYVYAFLGLFCLIGPSAAKQASPNVQVYSRKPGEFGKANILICHVSGFYPPEISIQLQKNGKEIPDTKQTDLAFEENWHYHLTKHGNFIPIKGETYTCVVNHMGNSKTYTWDPDL
ncbi:beta-2-microglobulin-like [Parambassis ranga]|uniref:Beta-2-microglobulin n=1 Tax=Parambassis ranga TaxID=210632 RepID=A0A6P7HRH7_9TELE|nr:beta-2-microglobulin-like [Parambassis ranga]